MSPAVQARLQEVQLSWAEGLKTHMRHQGLFRASPAEQFQRWSQGDSGPVEGELGFMEFWVFFCRSQ